MTQQMPERLPGGGVDLSHLAHRRAPGSAPAGPSGAGQTVDVPALVFDLTEPTLQQAVQLSGVVPVIVELWSSTEPRSQDLGPTLTKLAHEFGGSLVVARADVATNPGFIQAFQLQALPTTIAIVAGRPLPLFEGVAAEDQVREVLNQVLQVAAGQGIAGRVNAPEMGAAESEPATTVNPAHQEALDAIDRGDFEAAALAYEHVLANAPADDEARAALVQVRLLARLQSADAAQIRAAAAAAPNDVDAQLAVADLDVSGGHVEDAFLRLLDLFAATAEPAERTRIRERLLELFEVVGVSDPRVIAARGRLASLLY